MTEELKTLKDIDTHSNGDPLRGKDKLRQEAIKWVKYLDNLAKGTIVDNVREIRVAQADWIMHFFNLTEEDIGVKEK